MTRDQIVSLLAGKCGNRTDLNSIIIDNMDYVQTMKLEQSGAIVPWFLLTENASASLTPNEQRLPVPTDFLFEVDDEQLEVLNPDSGKYTTLTKETKDSLVDYFRNEAAGLPTHYALSGGYFLFFPTPDQAYTVRMKYAASQALPSSGNIENAWMKYAADLFMALTGEEVVGKHLKDPELLALFANDVLQARARLHTANIARQEANRDRSMGDD